MVVGTGVSWSCTASPGSARPRRSWTRSPHTRSSRSAGPSASRGRWNSPSRRSSSCATHARRHRAAPAAATRRARHRVRNRRWAGPEPVPRRIGCARLAVRSRPRAAAAVCRRRRPVARSCVGGRSRVRGSPPRGREDRGRVRDARGGRRACTLAGASPRALGHRDAHALLESVLPARLDEGVLERIIVETRGNPLALLELPRGLTPAQLAGGFGLPVALPFSAQIEESFTRRLAKLPSDARRLLLVAAADPVGDTGLVRRAARQLGIPESAANTVESDRLVTFGAAVVFRHPLVRSAVYGSADAGQRREVHRALAEATDPDIDPDRRAWHRAQAAPEPDEDIAADLERSAVRAQARGGFAAAAAFLERSAWLTLEPAVVPGALSPPPRRCRRLVRWTKRSPWLLARRQDRSTIFSAPSRRPARAISFATDRGSEAPALLLTAARRLEPLDAPLARGDLPRRAHRRGLRRSLGRRQQCSTGRSRRTGRAAIGAFASTGGPAARRAGAADHRRAHSRDAGPAERAACVPARGGRHRGRFAVPVAGGPLSRVHLGLRELGLTDDSPDPSSP